MESNRKCRFLKIPTIVYNVKQSDMTGKKDYIDTFHMINPDYIIFYLDYGYEVEDGNEEMGCWIQLANYGLQTRLSTKQVKKILDEFNESE